MQIINASWAGGVGLDVDIKPAIEMTARSGILFVAAAGNAAKDIGVVGNETSPAGFGYPNLITVGSINPSAGLSYFSNFNKSLVHVMAPAEHVLTTELGGLYRPATGTSFSAPMVAGMAAVMKARLQIQIPRKPRLKRSVKIFWEPLC
jgi:membrane-anchored mycosin MYCP